MLWHRTYKRIVSTIPYSLLQLKKSPLDRLERPQSVEGDSLRKSPALDFFAVGLTVGLAEGLLCAVHPALVKDLCPLDVRGQACGNGVLPVASPSTLSGFR